MKSFQWVFGIHNVLTTSKNLPFIHQYIKIGRNIKNLLYIKKGRKLFQSVFRIHQYIMGGRKSILSLTTI